MAIQATGRVVRDRRGLELIVERRLSAPVHEVWAWVTSPTQLKKWIGTYRGKPVVGGTVDFTMTFEKDAAAEKVTIVECRPEERVTLEWSGGDAVWLVSVAVADLDGSTVVYLKQRLANAREAGSVGPGWEYYLDRLVAATTGTSMPDFEPYLSVQQPYYERLAMDGDPVSWPPS
jgi:uncharacterized protein YndB with AHSA1/START domain